MWRKESRYPKSGIKLCMFMWIFICHYYKHAVAFQKLLGVWYRYMHSCLLGQLFVAILTVIVCQIFFYSSGSPGSRSSGRSRSSRCWDNSNSSPHRKHGSSKSSSQRWSPDTSSRRCADMLYFTLMIPNILCSLSYKLILNPAWLNAVASCCLCMLLVPFLFLNNDSRLVSGREIVFVNIWVIWIINYSNFKTVLILILF